MVVGVKATWDWDLGSVIQSAQYISLLHGTYCSTICWCIWKKTSLYNCVLFLIFLWIHNHHFDVNVMLVACELDILHTENRQLQKGEDVARWNERNRCAYSSLIFVQVCRKFFHYLY
jgi:hypothetical protein